MDGSPQPDHEHRALTMQQDASINWQSAPSAQLDAAKKDALTTLGHFYLTQARADKAITLLSALHRLEPNDIRIALSLAWAWLQRGEPEITLRLSQPGLRRTDHLGQAARRLQTTALVRLGRHDEARSLIDTGPAIATEEVV